MDLLHILIPIHAVAASFVILLGPVNFLRRRKDAAHRFLGRTFAVMMYFVCVSGLFIYEGGGFTVFHGLAIFTLITTTLGIRAIMRGDVKAHRGNMIGSWAGTVAAGTFAALVPGRAIPTLAVDDPTLFWAIVAAIIAAATLWVLAVLSPQGRRFLHGRARARAARKRTASASASASGSAEVAAAPGQ
ncbi:hypothetical protein AUC47_06590 [Microbacterium sp. SZ1]|uniref:DUF2306 domain-containing protein n=1 Tax=Microbacterium sp. SZ1 TaxID=1849736 RepID=UPI000BBC1D5A|nr:DUF2306 domain-containing protein [Microbacterium sp. SZ1]PCE13872.1 hypothetical protein AUC47_06590 [Microbacterium sp. SZ1]